jgi:hypothetical protein
MKKTIAISIAGIILILCSCKKENENVCSDAAIMWGGDPAADGLGWHLLTDSVNHIYYIPQNLPDSLKINGQHVNVCMYKTKENFYCECGMTLKKYHITSIRNL